jgi:hypothetical protein
MMDVWGLTQLRAVGSVRFQPQVTSAFTPRKEVERILYEEKVAAF